MEAVDVIVALEAVASTAPVTWSTTAGPALVFLYWMGEFESGMLLRLKLLLCLGMRYQMPQADDLSKDSRGIL